jgi:hypothetical protein
VSVHVQTDPSAPPTEQSVILEVCLHGKRFKPDLSMATTRMVFAGLNVKELRLEGQPGLMKTIEKQHNGHQDEITGTVIVPDNRDTRVQTRQIGKRTRVTTTSSGPGSTPDPRPAGDRTRVATNTLPQQEWLRVKVTSLRHLADKCQFAEELVRR